MTTTTEQVPTVFIVDDDPAIRFAMQALMDSVNIQHEIFSSADEFLATVPEQRPGCLVLDIRMPGLGGLELQQELIEHDNTLPIIFITAFESARTQERALELGARAFLRKPLDSEKLLEEIQDVLADG